MIYSDDKINNDDIQIFDNIYSDYNKSKNRPHVFFDITNQEETKRIIIELFNDVVPYTVDNFIYLVKNSYKGSKIHRIVKDFIIQGGDYINGDGTGYGSKYGDHFKDENFELKHDKYVISMANSGPNTNSCQFFITLNKCPSLDNKHVVFGKIIGEESQQTIDLIGQVLVDLKEKPIVNITISDCGIIENI